MGVYVHASCIGMHVAQELNWNEYQFGTTQDGDGLGSPYYWVSVRSTSEKESTRVFRFCTLLYCRSGKKRKYEIRIRAAGGLKGRTLRTP